MNLTPFTTLSSRNPSISSLHAPTDSLDSPAYGTQDLLLGQVDSEPCALGLNGNLQFTVREDAATPASRVGVLLPEMRRSLTDGEADLNAYSIHDSIVARAQRQRSVEARVTGRLIGGLLGSLTAKVNERGDFVNHNDCSRIARALIELSLRSRSGDLDSLEGVKCCLDTYLEELRGLDLAALTGGVLTNTKARNAVLDRISICPDDALRRKASHALMNIAEAVDRREVRRVVHEPLCKVVDLLASSPVDARELCAQLMKVSDGAQLMNVSEDEGRLNHYFRSLSADELKNLRSAVMPESLNRVRQILSRMIVHAENEDYIGDQAFAVWVQVSKSFESEFCVRSYEILMKDEMTMRLNMASFSGDQHEACRLLHELSVGASQILAVFGQLHSHSIVYLQESIERAMDILRDNQNNPAGPLNGHSLRKLDDDMRANLNTAAEVLRNFGLEIEPESRVC